ncbi:MAG: ArsR family transcriptional regulator [Gemmatimonadales bacterium]|nr:MAG: ArsR family transcriptional regulator [Gemmatimonadales bacterium]
MEGATTNGLRPLGLKGPRADIVRELKAAGGLAAREISCQLRLSANAVRHHLKELEAAGFVGHDREHRGGGVGAPTYVYRLTSDGEALFPSRYEDAVSRLLDHVVEKEGRAAAVEVLEARYRELADELRPILVDASPAERWATVTRTLSDEGYMPEVHATTLGTHLLVEHNCPIKQVAQRFPEVCEAEARFLAEVLEAHVTREAHISSGCGACEYQVGPVPLAGPGTGPSFTDKKTRELQ